MAGVQLKNIINRRSSSSAKLLSFIEKLKADIFIEDAAGSVLLPGKEPPLNGNRYPITSEEEIIGWVSGDEKAAMVADLLALLTEKELERKKIGNEVLSLYREVNQIFNFSEKLAQSIGPTAIAQTTLEEAKRAIPYDRAAVVLWNENLGQVEVIASKGDLLADSGILNTHLETLLRILLSGQSEILDNSHPVFSEGIVPAAIQSIVYAALKVKHRVMGAVILASDESNTYSAADLKLLVTFGLQCSSAIESALLYEKNIREANEREQAMRLVYEAAEKFVPYAFIGSLGHTLITDVKLGDQVEKVVTVLFTDIREFATLSEKMTPEANFAFICAFNEKMGPIIRKHNGFINQYLGDAIMAIFPEKASDAIAAAIEMQQAVSELNSRRHEKNYPHIQVGIGMHTGPLIMGITGDNERLDAATISDTVNTASRIESLTKYYKSDILITDACAREVEDDAPFYLRPLGKVQVKGKKESIAIYDCFAPMAGEAVPKKLATLDIFNSAINSYLSRSFTHALISFQQVLDQNPEDRTAHFFLGKTARYISSGVPEDWEGVEEMWEK
jgi:adenylate cyclase